MDNKYKPIPFWSWNDELDEKELTDQIEWMYERGIGGFFMHARGGLTTPYLGEKWFSCVEACLKKAKELGMEAYAYDENGWPSGFAGGELLKEEDNRDCRIETRYGPYDEKAYVSYDYHGERLLRVNEGNDVFNLYIVRNSSTADILNEEVVKKFIHLTHEQYQKHDIYGNLKGIFTDEPQYFRWGTPFTYCLEKYFSDHYHMDLKDGLGLLFLEKETYHDFRYKYWCAMQDLMLNAFAKQIYTWLDERGYRLTGHYVEERTLAGQMMCCAGIMPFYEYEHIPGQDYLSRTYPTNCLSEKQLCSAAAQLDKKQVLTESFALAGWDATPEELKHIAEYQFVNGVNLLCHHLLPYKEHGQRKRDYPEHYSAINPWAEDKFKLFNDTMSEIGYKIATSTEQVHVALFHPIRSAYFDFKRYDPYGTLSTLNQALDKTLMELDALHIPYHFIDETILEKHGKAEGSQLKIGACTYDILIFPEVYTMSANSDALFKAYAKAGGKILFLSDKPHYLEGKEHDYFYLNSNITLEEIVSDQPFTSSKNPSIHLSYRQSDDTHENFFYLVNGGEATRFVLNGRVLSFKKWESRFIKEKDLKDDPEEVHNFLTLGSSFRVSHPVDNFLTLDTASYSKDGASFSEPLHHMGIFDLLLHERYQGDLYLRYSFEVKAVPSVCFSLIEDNENKEVVVNGQKAKKVGTVLEQYLEKYDIAPYLKAGHNEIMVKMNFHQNEMVYYALFGENVTETLKNCLVYPTTIEAIYLMGNFGVYGNFSKGHEENTYLADQFWLGEQKKEISSLICDGFPFFRGKIELEQNLNVKNKNTWLSVPGRFQTIDVYLNDQFVSTMMFDHELDLSRYVNEGKNKLTLCLMVSNRNLLGPFHTLECEEDTNVGPFTFERPGSWKNGKSDNYRASYSFVKTIL